MPPKLTPSVKKGTPKDSHRKSKVSSPPPEEEKPVLRPLRNPAASGGISPALKKAALKQKQTSVAQQKLNSPEAAIKALRQDLLQVQNLIDGTTSRSILNYNQRKLETEILLLQQNNQNTPDQQIMDLLNLLAVKCSEAAETLGVKTEVVVGESPTKSSASVSPVPGGHARQAAQRMPPAPAHLSTDAVSTLASPQQQQQQQQSVVSTLIDLLKNLQQHHQVQQQQQQHPTFGADGERESSHDQSGAATPAGLPSPSVSTTGAVNVANFETASHHSQIMGASAVMGTSNVGMSQRSGSVVSAVNVAAAASGSTNAIPPSEAQLIPSVQPARMAPMSAGSLAQLEAVGIEVPTVEGSDTTIDTDVIVRQLVAAARRVKSLQDKLDHRLKANGEASVRRDAQSRLELEANQTTLQSAQQQIDDLKKTIASSRFAPNQTKALATVRDAPMSFQVEQQYQRDISRLQLRVQELESKYNKLWSDGVDDRETVKRLKAEGIQLRSTIAGLEADKKKLSAERDEQASLYQGASQARGEEARMSLTAVKQLESRVADLTDKLNHEKKCKEKLAENFKHLFTDFNKSERLLQQGRNRLECTLETFGDYKQYYNQETVETVARLQGQLITVSHSADEKEAIMTLQKQQLEDNEVLRNLTQGELSQFMERLKASTEWKMVNVRAADEARQLGMRLVAMISDREKKESGMAAQHAERLETYKARADLEILERQERRNQEIQVVDVDAIENEYKAKHQKRQQALEKLQSNSKPMEKIKLALKLKEEYTNECMSRVVSFSNFYEEKHPSDD